MADVYGYSRPAMADVDDDSSLAKSGLVKSEGEIYMESLVGASLLLASEDFPLEIRLHASEMLQHLMDYRSGQLSGAQLLNLNIRLVGCPSRKEVPVSYAANAGKPKGRNRSLLMLAAKNILRGLVAQDKAEFGRNADESAVESTTLSSPTFLGSVKRAPVFEDERVGFSLAPGFISSSTPSVCPILSKRLRQPPSVSEDERIHVSNDSNNIICVSGSEKGTRSSPENSDMSSTSSSSESGKMSQNSNSTDMCSTASSSPSGKRFQNRSSSMSILDDDETIILQRKDNLLLTEHNLLCEAFSITTSVLGTVQYARIIPCLLDPLNKIWSLVEWKYVSWKSLLFSDGQFLKMVYHVVKFAEDQLKRRKTEEYGACDLFSVALLRQILPLLLQLLPCVHEPWNQDEDAFLPEELKRAKCLSCEDLAGMLASTNGLYAIDNEEYLLKNERGALLEGIRQRVYNVLGLFTSIEGAFSKLLDSQTVRKTLTKDLWSMELRHLGKVIRLVVVPLVENCPSEFWEQWTSDFLEPMLGECVYRLHYAWFDLLYQGGTGKPYFYGNLVGSVKQIEESKRKLLLAFTREVSDLLIVFALAERNMESLSSSLLSFLLRHECFERMRMSLFGYFVDDETTMKAVPFCHSLTRLATNGMGVRHLILNDLLPCLIQRLDDQLPCAIQRLRCNLGLCTKATASKDLEALCEEWYNHFVKDSAGEDKGDGFAENNFTAWLTKKKNDLKVQAYSPAQELLDASDWNWEFEDEFRRFLPVYMDMLQEVDSIQDEECGLFDRKWLFQKLKAGFRYKYGMNSCNHHYMTTIVLMWQRKVSMACIIINRNKGKFVSEIIKLKPYIKASDSSSAILGRLEENSEISFGLPLSAILSSLSYLLGVLRRWEPVFHPLIRESHMDLLLKVVDQYTKWKEGQWCLQVEPAAIDFESHLQPYAETCFESMLKEKEYYIATEQIGLHKKFDSYLASGVLDTRMDEFRSSKDDFVKDLIQNEMVKMQLSDLHHELINFSLERRYELVKIHHQVVTYSQRLQSLLKEESLKGQLGVWVKKLENEGFFDTDNDSVDWKNKHFTDVIDEFRKVFSGRDLPRHYVIRGIIDYREISMYKDCSLQVAFRAVAYGKCRRWIHSCEEIWNKSSCYEHHYYHIVRRPLEKVFTPSHEIAIEKREQ